MCSIPCPYIFLVIILMVIFNRNFFLLFVAIGAVEWLTMARIVRGQTLSIKQKEFIEAARAGGVGALRHHPPPHHSQCGGAGDRLCDPDRARRRSWPKASCRSWASAFRSR